MAAIDNDTGYGAVSVGVAPAQPLYVPRVVRQLLVTVHNAGSVTIYLGRDAAVTTSTGLPVLAGEKVQVSLSPGENLYGVSGTAAQDVRVFANGPW